MKLLLTLTAAAFLLTSCGRGNPFAVEAEVEDSNHTVDTKIDAETYNYIIIRLEFITEINDLCKDSFDIDEVDYKKSVASCTLDHLSILDIGKVLDFNDSVCNSPETNDETDICNAISGESHEAK